jgi:hypothetical protein
MDETWVADLVKYTKLSQTKLSKYVLFLGSILDQRLHFHINL